MPTTDTTPRKSPQQARSRDTVDCILEGAAQVFETHGYAAGTTNRIAERAGVSIGSVYQYFPNKDAILVELIERHIEESRAILTPVIAEAIAAPTSLANDLGALLDTMATIHRERPGLHRVLFEESPRPAQIRSQLDEIEEQAIAAISAYLDSSPEVTARDTQTAARLIATLLEGATHRIAIADVSDADWQATADELVRMLVSYLTASTA